MKRTIDSATIIHQSPINVFISKKEILILISLEISFEGRVTVLKRSIECVCSPLIAVNQGCHLSATSRFPDFSLIFP